MEPQLPAWPSEISFPKGSLKVEGMNKLSSQISLQRSYKPLSACSLDFHLFLKKKVDQGIKHKSHYKRENTLKLENV